MTKREYRKLTAEEIKVLLDQGCSALNWGDVAVADGFNAVRVRNTHFAEMVRIGRLSGNIKGVHGLEKACGIFNAVVADCIIGDDVRIANVAGHLSGYDIGAGVCIENVGVMETRPDATFGNGVELEVLNEAGGREVVMFDELSAQFAYLMCLHRYRPKLVSKLRAIADKYAESVRSSRGTIGEYANISGVNEIIDVRIGAWARINGAAALVNGTVLSSAEASTVIGAQVTARDFIVAESTEVADGVVLQKSFVGQGCRMGKQFSAENSLFFANCEGFHGEACSIFAGPYTVTHHKSTLLIAGLFSFYNAGSGTNQSNHMYKLGPCHEGKLERGTKTGSFSYMMWPCRTGAFSVVLGKHTGTFDTSEFPFSHLEARSDGKCTMVPGLYLTTVGTVRDGAKWPSRDRRDGKVKRDIICFDVLSPYTVGKMICGSSQLQQLQKSTDKAVEEVLIGGALVRRPILRAGQKFYRTGIEMYLLEKVVDRAEKAIGGGREKLKKAMAVDSGAVSSDRWLDVCGQLMAKDRLVEFEDAIEKGDIDTLEGFSSAMQKINEAYEKDEWAWVKQNYSKVFGGNLDEFGQNDLLATAEAFFKIKSRFIKLVLADAEKEFDQQGRCGFGQDGEQADRDADFEQVRGRYADNKFVKEMQGQLEALQERIRKFEQEIAGC